VIELGRAQVLFTDRRGGVSEGPYESLNLGILTDDERERVLENRRRVIARTGVEDIGMGWQVHGTEVLEWHAPRPGEELEKVDGHTTRRRGLGLLVLVADCLPVALASEDRVAMLHCGWRGLAGGIVERAVEMFEDTPEAAVGPGIGRCCYEVGEEVLGQFAHLDGVADGRMLDLRAVAQRKLEAAGVTRVEHIDLCTSCNRDLFFSHRRDNGVTGRQGGLAWLRR
jgi:polyphenol oxidase